MATQPDNALRSEAPRGTRSRIRFLRGLVLFAGSLLLAGGTRAETSKEYQIKAAFLFNFTKFVEWPAERFASADAPIVIGVLGENPFGGELAKIVRDRKVNGRCLSIVALRSPNEAGAVHVLFVTAGEGKRFDDAGPLNFRGVLTVVDSVPFAAQSGMVNFTTANDKVRFEINADAAESAGLKISAQLLKLATVVRKKS